MQNIKEKVVVITSASSGLGKPASLSLPKQALCWVRDRLVNTSRSKFRSVR